MLKKRSWHDGSCGEDGGDEGARVVACRMEARDLTCAFSPGRELALTGVVGHRPRIWNTATGECVRELAGHTDRTWGVAWCQKRPHLLASSGWDHTARVWHGETGECLAVLEGHRGFVRSVEFDEEGGRLITGSQDCEVRVWELPEELGQPKLAERGEPVRLPSVACFAGHSDSAYCGLLDRQGEEAVSGSRDGTVRIWELATGECRRVIRAHSAKVPNHHVQHLAWLPGEREFLSCSIHIRLWERESGKCLQEFAGSQETVRSVAYLEGRGLVLSAAHDRRVRVWEVSSGRCLESFEAEGLLVRAEWVGDGKGGIIACDEQGRIYRWT